MSELEEHLQDQLAFLDASCDAYDRGNTREAFRLATTVRVLVHDTAKSHSLLGQLGIKEVMKYVDGRSLSFDHLPPLMPNMVDSSPGLAVIAHFYAAEGNTSDNVEYWPAFRGGDDLLSKPLVPFDVWWKTPVSTDTQGTKMLRRHYILSGANKDGGAHIDTDFKGTDYSGYHALTRDRTMGNSAVGSTVIMNGDPTAVVVDGMSPALAVIRHIAEEMRISLRLQIPGMLGDLAVTPPAVKIERPFMFTGDKQISITPGFSVVLGPQPAE